MKTGRRVSPLHYAAKFGRDAMVEFLLSRGADLYAPGEICSNDCNLGFYDEGWLGLFARGYLGRPSPDRPAPRIQVCPKRFLGGIR
jgi:hypothetical protein